MTSAHSSPLAKRWGARRRSSAGVSPTTQAKGLGAFDLVSLQKGVQAYKAFGLIQRDLSVQDVVSQDLLPAP